MSKYILVIDDERDIIDVLKDSFETESDIKIEGVTSPLEALEKIHNNKYQAIVTDIKMPEKTGLDVVNEVRWSESPNAEVPIFIFTAFKAEFDTLLTFKGKDIYFFDKVEGPDPLKEKVLSVLKEKNIL